MDPARYQTGLPLLYVHARWQVVRGMLYGQEGGNQAQVHAGEYSRRDYRLARDSEVEQGPPAGLYRQVSAAVVIPCRYDGEGRLFCQKDAGALQFY